jgi:hypothetical protein
MKFQQRADEKGASDSIINSIIKTIEMVYATLKVGGNVWAWGGEGASGAAGPAGAAGAPAVRAVPTRQQGAPRAAQPTPGTQPG